MVKVLGAGLAVLLGPLLVVAVLAGGQNLQAAQAGAATGGLPAVAAAAYRLASVAAEETWGCILPASLVGAIGAVESGHGRAAGGAIDPDSGMVTPAILGPVLDGSGAGGNVTPVWDTDAGALDGNTRYDRAVGPMQFLPSTWRRFEATVEGSPDPHNYYDATTATAWYLCNGRAADLTEPAVATAAILRYNSSRIYLGEVLAEQSLLEALLSGTWGAAAPDELLAHPRFSASPHAADDLAAGIVDPRLVGLLWTIVEDLELAIHVSPFRTGHSRCVGGGPDNAPDCSESHHFHGRGVDISVVDGDLVRAHYGKARIITDWLAGLAPVEELSLSVGSPWGDYQQPGFFTDAGHRDHIHLSVCGPRMFRGQVWSDCR